MYIIYIYISHMYIFNIYIYFMILFLCHMTKFWFLYNKQLYKQLHVFSYRYRIIFEWHIQLHNSDQSSDTFKLVIQTSGMCRNCYYNFIFRCRSQLLNRELNRIDIEITIHLEIVNFPQKQAFLKHFSTCA